jgi:hypothetical protein
MRLLAAAARYAEPEFIAGVFASEVNINGEVVGCT